jgi:hypothetical protein
MLNKKKKMIKYDETEEYIQNIKSTIIHTISISIKIKF